MYPMIITIDLRSYKAMVLEKLRLSRTGKPQVFENSGPDHARVVIGVLVGDCSKTLDILSGELVNDVWSAHSIREFLARGGESARIRVLLDDIPSDLIPKTSALFGLEDDPRIMVRRLGSPFAAHLCIGDKKHIRLEYKKSTCEASITFGDEQGVGKHITEMFTDLWNAGDMIGPAAKIAAAN
jgi:hypothetical protein